mmetsp:Transcript_24827/g.36703  ORF Transcript_24827/g.36703 Transcript_24827/m.36703 type:complete len:234 (+) Transcript_24827:126-827(+)
MRMVVMKATTSHTRNMELSPRKRPTEKSDWQMDRVQSLVYPSIDSFSRKRRKLDFVDFSDADTDTEAEFEPEAERNTRTNMPMTPPTNQSTPIFGRHKNSAFRTLRRNAAMMKPLIPVMEASRRLQVCENKCAKSATNPQGRKEPESDFETFTHTSIELCLLPFERNIENGNRGFTSIAHDGHSSHEEESALFLQNPSSITFSCLNHVSSTQSGALQLVPRTRMHGGTGNFFI